MPAADTALASLAAAARPATDVSDAVILHLWQANQIVIDLAMSACLVLRLGQDGPADLRAFLARLAAIALAE